jgi:prepilin-type N-terminal cleavage/methylation domain-containing protein/prepilin-type processing-associated H-X9-DG protein
MNVRRGTKPGGRCRGGFTLIELMVSISVLGLLLAILLPVLQRVRENARDTQCKSNLRQIASGLTQRASSSNSGEFCSGAWDWKRDGAVTEVGWVADLVSAGTPVGELLCPSSPYHLSRVYHELLTMNPTTNSCANSLGGPDNLLLDGTRVVNPCRQLVGAANKPQIIDELILQKYYNTNYAASWFLVRTDVIIDNRGALVNKNPGCATGLRERSCTVGPLVTARTGGKIPANIVPLMACGAQADGDAIMLPQEIGEHGTDEFLADSYSSGPRDPTTLSAPVITGTASGNAVWFGPWNATLQDYRAFGTVHGGRRRGTCNVVFLDGSIKTFTDENGDELLNNGFPASTVSGFQSDVVELPAAEIHSQWSLDSVRLR